MKVNTPTLGSLVREEGYKLRLGAYQRSVVWKDKQKAELIDSILMGYPIGVIVLNRIERKGVAQTADYDIIDGQQRLTAIKEFWDDPLLYITKWRKEPGKKEEEEESLAIISSLRSSIDEIVEQLKREDRRATKRELRERVLENIREYCRRGEGAQIGERYRKAVELVRTLKERVAGTTIPIQILEDDTLKAEKIYEVLNTKGTTVSWWYLLLVKDNFRGKDYGGEYTNIVSRYMDELKRREKFVRDHGTDNLALWYAMYALGEYYQSKVRLGIDGLGFRLVSAFLSHEINRAATAQLLDSYDSSIVKKAIDALFKTAEVLERGEGDFSLFRKCRYLSTRGVLPAYPFVGIILCAAKLIAENYEKRGQYLLSRDDGKTLRRATEELFREYFLGKWKGSGDSRLKEWLDRHSSKVENATDYLGRIDRDSFVSGFNGEEWMEQLGKLEPVGGRIDRPSCFFTFWVQYVYGRLPDAEIEFDHIVPYDVRVTETRHPLNLVAVSKELNSEKRERTFEEWKEKSSSEKVEEYRRYVLDDIVPHLQEATTSTIRSMIEKRRTIFEKCFKEKLPQWIDNGD